VARSAAQERWLQGQGHGAYTFASECTVTRADGTVEIWAPLPPGPLDRVRSLGGDTDGGGILAELSDLYFSGKGESDSIDIDESNGLTFPSGGSVAGRG
jgi:hypothetical protein